MKSLQPRGQLQPDLKSITNRQLRHKFVICSKNVSQVWKTKKKNYNFYQFMYLITDNMMKNSSKKSFTEQLKIILLIRSTLRKILLF